MAEVSPGAANLLVWWELDEASGDRADSHGSYTLTDVNTVTTAEGGADFDNDNAEKLTSSHANLSWADEAFTITGWVWLDDVGADHTILGRWESTGNHRQYELHNDAANNRFEWRVSDNGTNDVAETNATEGETTGEYIFFAVWHDPTGNTIGLRINANTESMAHTTGLSDDQAEDFALGSYGGGAYMDGKEKVVNVWTALLSDDNLDWLYNSGSARTYGDLSTTIEVPLGTLTIAGLVPTVSPLNLDIPLGSLSITGLVPTFDPELNIDVPLGTLTITGLAPLINDETLLVRTADGTTLLASVVGDAGVLLVSDGTNWYALNLPEAT